MCVLLLLEVLKAPEVGSMGLSQSSHLRSTLGGDGICQARGMSSAWHLSRVLPQGPPPTLSSWRGRRAALSGNCGPCCQLGLGNRPRGVSALPPAEVRAGCLPSHPFHCRPHHAESDLDGQPGHKVGRPLKPSPAGHGSSESQLCPARHANICV